MSLLQTEEPFRSGAAESSAAWFFRAGSIWRDRDAVAQKYDHGDWTALWQLHGAGNAVVCPAVAPGSAGSVVSGAAAAPAAAAPPFSESRSKLSLSLSVSVGTARNAGVRLSRERLMEKASVPLLPLHQASMRLGPAQASPAVAEARDKRQPQQRRASKHLHQHPPRLDAAVGSGAAPGAGPCELAPAASSSVAHRPVSTSRLHFSVFFLNSCGTK